MTTIRKCAFCKQDLVDNDRVIFSARETFVFKPAHVPDDPIETTGKDGKRLLLSPAASLSPEELRERRKEHTKTEVVNTFCDWGKAHVPQDAFNFRHQWCEPQRTGASGSLHAANKHVRRFGRRVPGILHG